MSQTVEQLTLSLERLFVLQYFKDTEKATYVQTIYEKCAWIDAYRFDQVVQEMCGRIKTNQRQKPAHFIETYYRLAEEKGWARAQQKSCTGCGGINFVPVWVKDKRGVEFKAVRGCPECNTRYSALHPDFTEISGPTDPRIDPVEALRKVKPIFAEILLEAADKSRLNLKPEILDALCEAASAKAVKVECHPVKLTAKERTKRTNQLTRDLIESEPPPSEEKAEREQAATSPLVNGSSPSPRLDPAPAYSEEDLKDVPF